MYRLKVAGVKNPWRIGAWMVSMAWYAFRHQGMRPDAVVCGGASASACCFALSTVVASTAMWKSFLIGLPMYVTVQCHVWACSDDDNKSIAHGVRTRYRQVRHVLRRDNIMCCSVNKAHRRWMSACISSRRCRARNAHGTQ